MKAIKNTDKIEWRIYKIESPSGRIYIGKTRNIKRRQWVYGSSASCKKQPLLHKSILKYGWVNHKMEVIETFTNTASYCNDKEMFWIRTYMSNVGKWPDGNGLNLTDGGSGTIGWVPSLEVRAKIAASNLGKIKHSEEWKKANAERMKGHTFNRGRKRTAEQIQKGIESKKRNGKKINRSPASEETKRKMSIARTGKRFKLTKKRDNSHCGRRVSQFDINGGKIADYRNIEQAADATGISYDKIYYDLRKDGANCHRRVKIKEYTFKYSTNAAI